MHHAVIIEMIGTSVPADPAEEEVTTVPRATKTEGKQATTEADGEL